MYLSIHNLPRAIGTITPLTGRSCHTYYLRFKDEFIINAIHESSMGFKIINRIRICIFQ